MLGIINLNKPAGKTSHDMVACVRRALGIRRVGHAGTLDPAACGVLPILVGKATCLSDLLTEKTKTYIATVRLGVETDTYDTTGQVIHTSEARPEPEAVCSAAAGFVGRISQLPPMYSAVKVQGQKLYQLARQGLTVEREPRRVEIYSLSCFDFTGDSFRMEVQCSKGTYIRSLCHDLGQLLGCGAAMEALVRTQSGPFLLEAAHSPEAVEQAAGEGALERVLLPPEAVLSAYPAVRVPESAVGKIKNGLRMRPAQLGIADAAAGDCFRLYDGSVLLCLAELTEAGGTPVLALKKTFF